jgi:biopolymer transport protein ExbD
MTPMIDVTFQLIAFFMFVLNVNDAEQHQAIRLPASDLAKPPEEVARTVFTVHVTKPEDDGKSYVYFANRKLAIGSEDLKAAIQKERIILGFERRTPGDANVVVLVRGDASAQSGEVQRVVEGWREEGFVHFALRVRQEVD